MYEFLIILLLIVEAKHDVYRDGILCGNVYYTFIKERKSKLIKLAGFLLGCLVVYLLTKSFYLALFPVGARVVLFDQIENYLAHGKLMGIKEWVVMSEIWRWYLIIFKGEK